MYHRASTYERLLWSSLKARSVLLKQLHQDGDPAALRHCRQLSALISCSGLEATTPAVRDLQMEVGFLNSDLTQIVASGATLNYSLTRLSLQVFQLGVVMQPSSSEALCHLGNGQLSQYDATGKEQWLKDAELSFRASIEMEGKAIEVSVVPGKLKDQEWWKNREAKIQAKSSTASPSPSSAAPGSKGASSVPAGRKPPTTGSTAGAGRVQPSGSRQSGPSGRQQQPAAAGKGRGAAAGTTRTQTGGGPAARTQPGGARTQPGGARTQSGAGGRGGGTAGQRAGGGGGPGPAAKKPSVGGAAAKPGPASRQQSSARVSNTSTTSGKTVATLGDLKAGANSSKPSTTSAGQGQKPATSTATTKSSSTSVSEDPATSSPSKESAKQTEKNQPSYQSRLGLARTLVKTEKEDSLKEARALYEEVMKMSPNLHDAYIELGDVLQKKDGKAAVEVYARFPFQESPTFDDAFLHGEIIRLVMKSEDYDNPYLASSMIAMGKALGIGVLEKQVAILEHKFKYPLLKSVYAGVHGKPVDDPELQTFFKFKCWL